MEEVSEAPPTDNPAAGEKRAFTPGGKTYRINERAGRPATVGRAKDVAKKLVAMKKEAEDAEKAEQKAEGSTEEGSNTPDGQRESAPVEPQAGVVEEKTGAEGGAERQVADSAGGEEKPKDLNSQFAALARAERRHREESKRAKDELAKKEQEIAQKEADLAEISKLKTLVDKDKYAALDHLGLDVKEWARRQLGRTDEPSESSPPEYTKVLERLEAVEKRNQELEEERQQSAKAYQYQQVRQQSLAEIGELLQNESDRYEYTALRGGAEVVFATIEEHFNNTGDVLPYEQAAGLVEAHFESEAESYLKASKSRKKFASQDEPAAEITPERHEDKPAARKQLNRAADRVSSKGLTKEERRRRAVAVMKANPQ